MLGQETKSQSGAMGESQNAIKWAVFFNGLIDKIISFRNGLVIVGIEGSRPIVEGIVWPFKDVSDPRTRRRVNLSLDEVKAGTIVFLDIRQEGV